MNAEDAWQLLADALAARVVLPPLLPEQPWRHPDFAAELAHLMADEERPNELRIAAAVLGDRQADALALSAVGQRARFWQAVAMRRSGSFQQAKRRFRELGWTPVDAPLYRQALLALSATGPGFRWAYTSRSLLTARGTWDSAWFVDCCADVYSGLLSRESGALLEEIQRAELQILLGVSASGRL